MISNEQFHELFTPVAWEIFTSYSSELNALMEKYQINENQYSFIKKHLENHVSNWVKDAKVTIIDEKEVQEIFHEIGQPLALLLALGFLFECRKCKTIRVVEKATCGSCGTSYIPNIFSVSILGSSQIQKLKQWIFSHPLAKFTLFLILGVAVGIGIIKLHFSLFSLLIFIGILAIAEYYNNIPISKFYGILGFFVLYFIKGLFLIFIALMVLINLLMYDLDGHSMLFREELIPITSILITVLLCVLNQPNNKLNYFKYMQLKKQLQFRFKLLWLFEIMTLVILSPIYISLTFIEGTFTILGRNYEYDKIIGMILLVIVPFLSGIAHLFALRPYLIRFGEKNSILETN